jgi:O-methyltransferase
MFANISKKEAGKFFNLDRIDNSDSKMLKQLINYIRYNVLFIKYSKFTMISKPIFIDNMILCEKFKWVEGDFVECGVWRGGMSGAIAEVLGKDKFFYLFDSFEGLPTVKEIDGIAAKQWQDNKTSSYYYNNCKAEINFAETAMKKAGVRYQLVKGWFKDTLPSFAPKKKIAILRLDGDWYDSTMDCLTNLYPLVEEHGLIIIDDYYAWDGCARAVHDYLSQNKLPVRIHQTKRGVFYIIKTSNGRQL